MTAEVLSDGEPLLMAPSSRNVSVQTLVSRFCDVFLFLIAFLCITYLRCEMSDWEPLPQPIRCLDANHVSLQLDLNETLTKYEKALLEIKALRNKKKSDDAIAEILKRLEGMS